MFALNHQHLTTTHKIREELEKRIVALARNYAEMQDLAVKAGRGRTGNQSLRLCLDSGGHAVGVRCLV